MKHRWISWLTCCTAFNIFTSFIIWVDSFCKIPEKIFIFMKNNFNSSQNYSVIVQIAQHKIYLITEPLQHMLGNGDATVLSSLVVVHLHAEWPWHCSSRKWSKWYKRSQVILENHNKQRWIKFPVSISISIVHQLQRKCPEAQLVMYMVVNFTNRPTWLEHTNITSW